MALRRANFHSPVQRLDFIRPYSGWIRAAFLVWVDYIRPLRFSTLPSGPGFRADQPINGSASPRHPVEVEVLVQIPSHLKASCIQRIRAGVSCLERDPGSSPWRPGRAGEPRI